MSPKNLNVIKIPKVLKDKLSNKRIIKIFNSFNDDFNIKDRFIVAVSGGPDSLALAFLTKIYSIKNKVSCRFFIVDHKLRKESTFEAKKVKKILSSFNIKLEILTWKGKKPSKNIQSIARKKRYELLFSKCKQLGINNLIVGHHLDDLFENFFIRMVRGSGLKGLVSLEKKKVFNKINLIRPLIYFEKKDLEFISNNVFNFFVSDPSNKDTKFTRIRIRKLINKFKKEGFEKDKLFLTLNNLKMSNHAISFYVNQNKKLNSFFDSTDRKLVLSKNFFLQPYEIVFRSFSDSITLIGKKYNAVRGKKIDNILDKIGKNTFKNETLGGCIIKKAHHTVVIHKEH